MPNKIAESCTLCDRFQILCNALVLISKHQFLERSFKFHLTLISEALQKSLYSSKGKARVKFCDT